MRRIPAGISSRQHSQEPSSPPPAWRTLIFAEEEARRRHATIISPELLILGLLREQTGAGYQIVRDLCGNVDRLAGAVAALLPASDGRSDSGLEIGPETSRAIRRAIAMLQAQMHLQVGQVHLLLAILGQDGPLVHTLAADGVTASAVFERRRPA